MNCDNLNIIVKLRFGSYMYGTNTPDSDLDYKGVFLPNKRQILLGSIPKALNFDTKKNSNKKNTSDDIDCQIYSLHYFIKMACEGQTGPIDMLHCPKNMLKKTSEIWDFIVENRSKFYTKNLNAFVGYARTQAAKYGIKGSRLNDAEMVVKFLLDYDNDMRVGELWDKLPEGEHINKIEDKNGILLYQVCGRSVQQTARVEYVFNIFNNFLINYGERARMAAENEGLDWKAVSHAVRAAIQVKEIFTEGNITYPLREAEYLKKIKTGQLHYKNEVAPKLENLMEEIETLSKNSELPEKVDRIFWDNFIMEVIEKYVI